jgi:hypothetical protein
LQPSKTTPTNRLDLARWIASPENPLTARVIVNRIWQQYFGRGLVETENDFGTQGTPPSHPELLDWLAAELVAHAGGLKHLHFLIATSATYRQSSRARPDLAGVDANNKLLARQTRLRLDAEVVRDAPELTTFRERWAQLVERTRQANLVTLARLRAASLERDDSHVADGARADLVAGRFAQAFDAASRATTGPKTAAVATEAREALLAQAVAEVTLAEGRQHLKELTPAVEAIRNLKSRSERSVTQYMTS